jgi:hypothetical protein
LHHRWKNGLDGNGKNILMGFLYSTFVVIDFFKFVRQYDEVIAVGFLTNCKNS